MSETATISTDGPARRGPGRLVLVVGPSGAGKDTLIGLAQAACSRDPGIVFPRRAVTREASEYEVNDPVSPAEFEQAQVRGDFALHWDAHGLRYGVPRSIDADLGAGRTVVVNVSRTVIAPARQLYADVTVVLITAPPEVLANRLAARDRKSDGRLEDRLRRSAVMPDAVPDVIVNNVGRAEEHAGELLRAIRGRDAERQAGLEVTNRR